MKKEEVLMNAIVEISVNINETKCRIELEGLPSCCEARELKAYIEENTPSLEKIALAIMDAHKRIHME